MWLPSLAGGEYHARASVATGFTKPAKDRSVKATIFKKCSVCYLQHSSYCCFVN